MGAGVDTMALCSVFCDLSLFELIDFKQKGEVNMMTGKARYKLSELYQYTSMSSPGYIWSPRIMCQVES